MVIVEAMALGMPVVAYDFADRAQGHHHRRSRRVRGPRGPTRLFADALGALMRDADTRHRFGEAALEAADRYRIDAIGARWTALFDELSAARAGRATAPRNDAARARARA